jgi:Lrp/AsnC family transcriptional regulator, leucine-responsive regulatory protein
MSHKTEFDSVDRRILTFLQRNARMSNVELARRVGMAPSAVLARVRKLERCKAITGYEARVSPKALNLGLTGFTFVRAEEPVGATRVGEQLAKIPEVLEVHHTAGQECYLLKVRVADTDHLARLLKRFGLVPAVRDTRTTIVLTTIKETGNLPVDAAPQE